MEVDELQAPDDLKARLLAMQPSAPAPDRAAPAPKKGRTVRFPHWKRWAAGIAACAAVAVVGSQALVAMGPAGAGISTMSLMAGGSASSTASSMAAYDRAAPEAAAYSLEENGLSARSVTGGQSAVAGEKIIYTADIALETKDYDAARAALEQALADAGGWMESSNESSYDNARSLSMTLRVPAENYDSFLAAAGQTASLVRRSEHADDVTAQYTDTAGRIANLEGQRDRLRELQAPDDLKARLLAMQPSQLHRHRPPAGGRDLHPHRGDLPRAAGRGLRRGVAELRPGPGVHRGGPGRAVAGGDPGLRGRGRGDRGAPSPPQISLWAFC